MIGGTPPDPNSAVGPSDIVEIVNSGVAVFDKRGNTELAPVATNSLWSNGTLCGDNNDGDGVVRYDTGSQRFVISQFEVTTGLSDGHSYAECVAVSQTSDPTGVYYSYEFDFSNFPDYPKFGVWPDGYYFTYNVFNGVTEAFAGAETCVLDRSAMVAGAASPVEQCIDSTANSTIAGGGLLPADMEGALPPPVGTPNYQMSLDPIDPSLIDQWAFHVDWTTPNNTTLLGPTQISVASYTGACAGSAQAFNCVPQSGTTTTLDTLGDRLMFPLVYRNFGGGLQSLMVSHSIDSTTGTTAVAERWYEFRVDSTDKVSLYQQGTVDPGDGVYRWMGSLNMDQAGDMALGYSGSTASQFPDVRYTGRLATDPLGQMGSEQVIHNGAGSESGQYGRWGDYTSMNVDPADNCRFWYTDEYYASTAQFTWQTRIASFVYPNCGVNDFSVALGSTSGSTWGGQTTSSVITTVTKGSPESVALSVVGLPQGASASFSPLAISSGDTSTLTISAGTALPGIYPVSVVGSSGSAMRAAAYSLTVGNDFSISLAPTSTSVQSGGTYSVPVTVNTLRLSGTAETVALTISGLPPGATASFSPTSVTAGTSSTLTIHSGTAALGTYHPIVTGTAPSATHTASETLTIYDHIAPTASLTQPTASFVVGSAAGVAWTGGDVGSGIAYYQLQQRASAWNGTFPTTWTLLATHYTTASTTISGLVQGDAYCWQVRAVDHAGNVGTRSAARCIAVPLDDRALAVSSGWTRVSNSAYWNGTATQSTILNAYLTRTGAELDRVGIVASRCSTCGIVGIYVNGALIGKINLYGTGANRVLYLLPVFSYRTGTVMIKVLTSGKLVVIDGLAVSRV